MKNVKLKVDFFIAVEGRAPLKDVIKESIFYYCWAGGPMKDVKKVDFIVMLRERAW